MDTFVHAMPICFRYAPIEIYVNTKNGEQNRLTITLDQSPCLNYILLYRIEKSCD